MSMDILVYGLQVGKQVTEIVEYRLRRLQPFVVHRPNPFVLMDSTTALPGSRRLIVLALTKAVRDAQNAKLYVPPTRYMEKANVDTSTPVGFNMSRNTRFAIGLGLTALGAMLSSPAHSRATSTALVPASMSSIGTVEERFQAYNVEMLEVTGGRFWKPYKEFGSELQQQ